MGKEVSRLVMKDGEELEDPFGPAEKTEEVTTGHEALVFKAPPSLVLLFMLTV